LLIVSGVFQYFQEGKIITFLLELKNCFPQGELIFDATNAIGIKYANKCVQKTGNTSAQMYFYVNDGSVFAQKCGMELIEQRTLLYRRAEDAEAQIKIVYPYCDESVR